MRRHLINISAIVIAISLWSFSRPSLTYSKDKFPVIYLLATTNGPQWDESGYLQQSTIPLRCLGTRKLCWLAVQDRNYDGMIDQVEFNFVFGPLDADDDLSLDDNLELPGLLEKRQ